MTTQTITANTISTTDPENFDVAVRLAVRWAEARFGQDARVHQISQYRHHADTMVRVEGYDGNGRHFTDERYVAELPRLIEKVVANRA